MLPRALVPTVTACEQTALRFAAQDTVYANRDSSINKGKRVFTATFYVVQKGYQFKAVNDQGLLPWSNHYTKALQDGWTVVATVSRLNGSNWQVSYAP
jgi:hypothetical protein